MTDSTALEIFAAVQAYYDSIEYPKYRNVDLAVFKQKYDALEGIRTHLETNMKYIRLVSAMSQIIARLDHQNKLKEAPEDKIWSNLSERGMNIAIRPAYRSKTTDFPVEWTDKWGYDCYLNHGYWEAKNYRVMDALGYMLLLKEGGNTLPKENNPIFNDLGDVMLRENQLNPDNCQGKASARYSIGFTDSDFRKMTGLKLSSLEILNLLLETQRAEFKLTFPVRLKSTEAKQQIHRMNIYSRFFELAAEEFKVRKDGVVQERRYRVLFNTILGELFVNNLKARFNDRIDQRLYALLPDSAQILYRRLLLHHNRPRTEVYLSRIAELAGLNDSNETNLKNTIEQNILMPLQEHGYIHSYEETKGLNGTKYVICRNSNTKGKDGGSVKPG